MLELIPPDQEVSIEREVFPKLVGEGLYGRRLEGYWIDIGTPERFRQANWDILEGRVADEAGRADRGRTPRSRRRATVAERAVIGPGTAVGEDAVIERVVLLDGCRVGAGAELREAILAAGVEIAAGHGAGAGLGDRRGRAGRRAAA